MGKIRTRILGLEDIEQQQKEEQKKRSQEKKLAKKGQEEPKQEEVKETKKEGKKEKTVEVKKHVRGKKYDKAKKSIDKDKLYTINEAVTTLKKIKFANFDESVELHINALETGLKGEVELPHSTGKTTRVTIVDDSVLENLEKGVIDFDVLIAHPSFMPRLAKFARILGPKGLMPNPKSGTVSPQPEEVAKKFEKGTLRWKTEAKFPLIHQLIGKLSADEKALVENAVTFLRSVGKKNMKNAVMKSSMSPSVKLNLEEIA